MPEMLIFIAWLINLYMWLLILSVILSWLVSFNVVNRSNQLIYMVGTVLHRLTEPVLGRIRRVIPPIGGLDITPVIAIIGLIFLREVVVLGWLMRAFTR